MNCSLVSSDLLPGKLKNTAIMNPSSFPAVEILQVTLTQQQLLRKDPDFGYGSAITARLCCLSWMIPTNQQLYTVVVITKPEV